MSERATPRDRRVEWLRAVIERKQKVRFWGRNYYITPRVLPTPIGDGRALLWVTPLNTRPNHYLVQIPGDWTAEDIGGENIDRVLDAIEEHFGPAFGTDDAGKEYHEPFPALDDANGVSWSRCDWTSIADEAIRRTRRCADHV